MAWSRLQSNSAAEGGATIAAAYTSALSAGTKLIAFVSAATQTCTGVSDGTNSFGQLATISAASGARLYIFALDTPAGDVGATPTITATLSGTANGSAILIQEVSGLAAGSTAAACLDGTAGTGNGNNSGAFSATLGSYTSAAANEYLVAVYSDDGDTSGSTGTTPSGYSADAKNLASNGNDDLLVFYKNSTGGAESPASLSITPAGTVNWCTLFVAFKLAGGSPPARPSQPGSTWLRRFHHRQLPQVASVVAAVAAPLEQLLPPPGSRAAPPRRARLGATGAVAAGILAATTLSPQPASVPPAKPGPSIAHPAPHRAAWRGNPAPPALPFLTAKLPPTAVSPRPPHRAIVRWVLAKTTLSPQPSAVYPMPQPVPVRRPGPHRALWRGIAGPAPVIVAVAAVPPARPGPVTNRPPAPHRAVVRGILAPPAPPVPPKRPQPVISRPPPPHRAIGKGILAPATLSPQPSRVAPPLWRQPNAPRPPHRAIWRGIAGPAPAVVTVTAVPPARPGPVIAHQPPHRAIPVAKGIAAKTTPPAQPSRVPPPAWRPQPRAPAPHRAIGKGVLAKTTLSPQPSRVPGPQWRQPNAPRPPHRAVIRRIAGPAPAVIVVASVPPSRPGPVTNRPPAPHRATWRAATGAPGASAFAVARSASAVSARNASAATVTGPSGSSTITDPRDGAASVIPARTSSPQVTAPSSSSPGVS